MSEGLNTVVLVGNLGADPELRQAGDSQVCELRMATTESWSNNDGKRQEHTEWHTVVVWGNQAAACAKVLGKGWTLTVQGSIRTEVYEKDGEKRYKTKIRATRVIFGTAPGGRSERGNQDADPPSDRGGGRSDDRGGGRDDRNGQRDSRGGGGYRQNDRAPAQNGGRDNRGNGRPAPAPRGNGRSFS